MSSIPSRSNSIGWSQPFDAFSPTADERPPLNVRDFKGMDHRPLAAPSQRFRTIKIYPKDVAFIWRHSRAVIPLLSKEGRHIMNDITLKAEERHDWTSHSDLAWATAYLIATILLVLLWANIPA
jgi:hypothetical protein